ncbi:hypothetical protein VKT23_012823, partial [Stygiomarasmius scandens]
MSRNSPLWPGGSFPTKLGQISSSSWARNAVINVPLARKSGASPRIPQTPQKPKRSGFSLPRKTDDNIVSKDTKRQRIDDTGNWLASGSTVQLGVLGKTEASEKGASGSLHS